MLSGESEGGHGDGSQWSKLRSLGTHRQLPLCPMCPPYRGRSSREARSPEHSHFPRGSGLVGAAGVNDVYSISQLQPQKIGERKKKHCPEFLILVAFCFPVFFQRKTHTDMCMHRNT